MASFQQLFYCKNCKKNVSVNEKGQCSICNSTSLNKSWSVRFRYVQEDGKEVQKRLSGYSTRREANDAYIKFTATAKKYNKTDKESGDLTFNDLFEEYKTHQLSLIQNGSYKQSSYNSLCSKVNNQILPHFKNKKVKDISAKDILDWQDSLSRLSYKYKCVLRQQLSTLLNFADVYYNIPSQLKKVKPFKKPIEKTEMQVWTPQEFSIFLDCVDNVWYKLFFMALYLTGARRGEIQATTWADWDLENGILNIDKTFTSRQKKSTLPKNQYSIRKISLPTNLINVMKQYKNENFTNNNERIFTFNESTIDRVKTQACKNAQIKDIRIHDFRHSHASYLISEGVSIVAVAKRLGHGNIEQTLNTYSHLMPKEDDKIIETLDGINLGTFLGTKRKYTIINAKKINNII